MFSEEKVREEIENLNECDLIDLWNEYCDRNMYYDDRIEPNEPNDFLCGMSPEDILGSLDLDNYRTNDIYVISTIYGYRSFYYLEEDNSPFDISTLVDWICTEEDTCGYFDEEDVIEDEEEE